MEEYAEGGISIDLPIVLKIENVWSALKYAEKYYILS